MAQAACAKPCARTLTSISCMAGTVPLAVMGHCANHLCRLEWKLDSLLRNQLTPDALDTGGDGLALGAHVLSHQITPYVHQCTLHALAGL